MAIFFTSWAHAQNDSVIITHHQDTSRQWLIDLFQDNGSHFFSVGTTFSVVDTMIYGTRDYLKSINWPLFYLCTMVKAEPKYQNSREVYIRIIHAFSEKEARQIFTGLIKRQKWKCSWKIVLYAVTQLSWDQIEWDPTK